jgi:hypothetical protein
MAIFDDRAWIAAAYVAVGGEALLAARISNADRARGCWASIGAILLCCAALKKLGVQGAMTDWFRATARAHHFYQDRPVLQYAFACAALLGGAAVARWLIPWSRTVSLSLAIAALSATALVIYLFMRAASIHAIDPFVTFPIAGVRSGWWLELIALCVIAVAGGCFVREQLQRRKTP